MHKVPKKSEQLVNNMMLMLHMKTGSSNVAILPLARIYFLRIVRIILLTFIYKIHHIYFHESVDRDYDQCLSLNAVELQTI